MRENVAETADSADPGVCVCVWGGGGGISDINLVQVCSWAFSYPPYKCILDMEKEYL